jgi:hypothetical protein
VNAGLRSGGVGDVDRDEDGKGVPDSRGGMSSSRPVGNKRARDSHAGLLANTVIDNKSGRTSISHSVGKCIAFDAGRRDRRAECRATDDCEKRSAVTLNQETSKDDRPKLRKILG